MKRILIASLAFGFAVVSCTDKPESSGTNTNWLQHCVDSQDCRGAGSCLCGLCTNPCSNDSECAPGLCGSSLNTSDHCGQAESARLCLPGVPGATACTELPLTSRSTL